MFRKILIILLFISSLQIYPTQSISVEPDEILQDQKKELRSRNISKNIRCLVCQNQSIDESNAPLAKDLRILIRNQVKKGFSDKEIYAFLSSRYGDFILLKPPIITTTYVLWFLPLIFFIIGIYILFLHNKKSNKL